MKTDAIGPADFMPPVLALAWWWVWWPWMTAAASNSSPVDTLPQAPNRGE